MLNEVMKSLYILTVCYYTIEFLLHRRNNQPNQNNQGFHIKFTR